MPAIFSRRSGKSKGLLASGKNHPSAVSSQDVDRFGLVSPTPSLRDAQPLPKVPTKDDLPPLPVSSNGAYHHSQPELLQASQPRDPLREFGQLHQNRSPPTLPAKLADSQTLPKPRNGNGFHSQPYASATWSGSKPAIGLDTGRPMSPDPVPGRGSSRLSREASTATVKSEPTYPYGYTTEGNHVQLDPVKALPIVQACAEHIRQRGLDSPLIFSSMALDLTPTNVASLIRCYIRTGGPEAAPALPPAFLDELRFANPHDLAALVKWALARMGRILAVPVPSNVPAKKGEVREDVVYVQQRGFVEFDLYNAWRDGERRQRYPADFFNVFLNQLEPASSQLLTTLFSLLSSTTSYSLKNGMIPTKLAKHFGVLLFGLPEDETFARTYDAFVRASNATEHLFLAYIRSQAATMHLPPRLVEHVAGYPSMLATEMASPGHDAKMVPVTQVQRVVRLYSQDLIQTACEIDLPVDCPEWQACRHDTALLGRDPQLSDRFRKLINLRGGAAQGRGKSQAGAHRNGSERKEDEDLETHGSLISKQWSDFLFDGFSAPDESKLAFDLTETARKNRVSKRDTVQWTDFTESGFMGGDTTLDTVLSFDEGLKHDMEKLPGERDQILSKLRERQKALPPFRYDTTPRLAASPSTSGVRGGKFDMHPISRMDEAFADVWADYLIGTGWSNRDELTHRTASFVVVQYKSRPNESTVGSQGAGLSVSAPTRFIVADDVPVDPRVDAAWFVIQETVPAQYRAELEAAGRGKGRGKAMIRKLTMFRSRNKETPPLPLPAAHPPQRQGSEGDDDVFRPGPGGSTKHIRLNDPATRGFSTGSDREIVTYTPAVPPKSPLALTLDDPGPGPGPGPRASVDSGSSRNVPTSGGGGGGGGGKLMSSLTQRAKSLRAHRRGLGLSSPDPAAGAGESFTSDDYETRSLSPEPQAGAGRNDDAWIDIMLKANDTRMSGQDAVFVSRKRSPVPVPVPEREVVTPTLQGDETPGVPTVPLAEEPEPQPQPEPEAEAEAETGTAPAPAPAQSPVRPVLNTKTLVESLRAGLSPVEAVRRSKEFPGPSPSPSPSPSRGAGAGAGRIDPFAKDVTQGRVATVASKFGGPTRASRNHPNAGGLAYIKHQDQDQDQDQREAEAEAEEDGSEASDEPEPEVADEWPASPVVRAREPYQPGMPLDNVMEESESVMSGSNA